MGDISPGDWSVGVRAEARLPDVGTDLFIAGLLLKGGTSPGGWM